MIRVQDWAEIRHLHFAEGLSERAIADRVGVARGTVRRALAAEGPPEFSRPPAPSAFDVLEGRVRALLVQFPAMPASVIAERLGWAGSASWFRKRVALLRPEYAPKDATDRLEHRPGDQAQCDLWFPPALIPLGAGLVGSPPVLVVVASFSRFVTAQMSSFEFHWPLEASEAFLVKAALGAGADAYGDRFSTSPVASAMRTRLTQPFAEAGRLQLPKLDELDTALGDLQRQFSSGQSLIPLPHLQLKPADASVYDVMFLPERQRTVVLGRVLGFPTVPYGIVLDVPLESFVLSGSTSAALLIREQHRRLVATDFIAEIFRSARQGSRPPR